MIDDNMGSMMKLNRLDRLPRVTDRDELEEGKHLGRG